MGKPIECLVAADTFLHGGVTKGPEPDDFAVAVGEHVDRLLGQLALHIELAEHHDAVVAARKRWAGHVRRVVMRRILVAAHVCSGLMDEAELSREPSWWWIRAAVATSPLAGLAVRSRSPIVRCEGWGEGGTLRKQVALSRGRKGPGMVAHFKVLGGVTTKAGTGA